MKTPLLEVLEAEIVRKIEHDSVTIAAKIMNRAGLLS